MKKCGKYLVLALLVVAVAVSGVSAYFTANDTATNKFVVDTFDVELQEPNWVEADADSIVPNETIAKDPQVKNIGTADQFVFLKVTVPVKNIVTANADGSKNAAADTELFSWTVNEGWTLVEEGTVTNGVKSYIYAWIGTADDASDDTMVSLAQNEVTGTLFDSVTACNAVEGEGLESEDFDIIVEVYAIQSENLIVPENDATGKLEPSEILDIYLNQNADN